MYYFGSEDSAEKLWDCLGESTGYYGSHRYIQIALGAYSLFPIRLFTSSHFIVREDRNRYVVQRHGINEDRDSWNAHDRCELISIDGESLH